MKDSILGEIKSYTFNDKIIVALDERWKDYFGTDNPTFKAIIQNGNYVLVGPKVNSKQGPTSNPVINEVDASA